MKKRKKINLEWLQPVAHAHRYNNKITYLYDSILKIVFELEKTFPIFFLLVILVESTIISFSSLFGRWKFPAERWLEKKASEKNYYGWFSKRGAPNWKCWKTFNQIVSSLHQNNFINLIFRFNIWQQNWFFNTLSRDWIFVFLTICIHLEHLFKNLLLKLCSTLLSYSPFHLLQ